MTKHEAVSQAVNHLAQAMKILRDLREELGGYAPGPRALRQRMGELRAQEVPVERVRSVMDGWEGVRSDLMEKLQETLPDTPDFLSRFRPCLVGAEILDQMEAAVERELSSAEIRAAMARGQGEP